MTEFASRVSVVMLTYNRKAEVLRSLAQARAAAGTLPMCLVDNGCVDGTADAVRTAFPQVRILRLAHNAGAAGRNAGVRAVDTAYVAFCDDDTWWAPGAYARAAGVLDAHPRLAAVTGRVVVGAEEHDDDASRRMAASPLPNTLGVPGTEVLGVMAGACMVRRSAFLAVGGYEPRLFIGGEELLLALDFAAAGWRMAYVPDVVVHHHPSALRDSSARRRMQHRNAFWCAWLRRRWRGAAHETWRLLRASARDAVLARGAVDALAGLPWALARRRAVPEAVEEAIERVRTFYAGAWRERPLDALGTCRVPP